MLIEYGNVADTHTSTHTSTHASTHISTHISTHTSFDETMSKLSGNIKRLIIAIGTDEKSVKEIMEFADGERVGGIQ